MPEIEDDPHPLDLHARREPLTGAPALVVALSNGDDAAAAVVGRGLVKLLEQRGRKADFVVERIDHRGEALARAVEGRTEPVVVVSTAVQAWSLAHLDPLLEAVDKQDHVFGRRPLPFGARVARWMRGLPWRVLFANPLADVHTPCRVHRRDALAAIPLQSKTRFADVELVAKATFLKQLIDEVPVPRLEAVADDHPIASDLRAVWSTPTFRIKSSETSAGPA